LAPPVSAECACSDIQTCEIHRDANRMEEMTVLEILTGKGKYFPGFVSLICAYLDFIQCDEETHVRVKLYLNFLIKRASGQLMTTAAWMREFVTKHPDYKKDSIVSDSIAYDLMVECNAIGLGRKVPKKLWVISPSRPSRRKTRTMCSWVI